VNGQYWPLFGLCLASQDLTLRPMTEADLAPLADLLPGDVELDPAATRFPVGPTGNPGTPAASTPTCCGTCGCPARTGWPAAGVTAFGSPASSRAARCSACPLRQASRRHLDRRSPDRGIAPPIGH
jgi:hypothetical protein